MNLHFGRTSIQGETKIVERSKMTSGLVRIIHEAVYFRGFTELQRLKY